MDNERPVTVKKQKQEQTPKNKTSTTKIIRDSLVEIETHRVVMNIIRLMKTEVYNAEVMFSPLRDKITC